MIRVLVQAKIPKVHTQGFFPSPEIHGSSLCLTQVHHSISHFRQALFPSSPLLPPGLQIGPTPYEFSRAFTASKIHLVNINLKAESLL